MVQGEERYTISTPEERLDELSYIAQERVLRHTPQSADPITRNYEAAFADLITDDPFFKDFFLQIFNLDDDLDASLLRLKTHKTFQYLESAEFPDSVDAWKERLGTNLRDSAYHDKFMGNVFLPVMSNVSERGILLKAAAMLHGKTQGVSILDTGCSLNEVLKRLALERTNPLLHYRRIDVRRDSMHGTEPEVDSRATDDFNMWLGSTALKLEASIGMDVMPYSERDESLRKRAESDSSYMGESDRGERGLQSELLAAADVPEISFMNEDVALMDPESLGRKFDITSGLTWLYMAGRRAEWRPDAQKLRPSELRRALYNMESATKEDGIVVVQDFIREFRRNRLPQFYPEHQWNPGTYGLWVKDMQRPELGYQRYLMARSGRVEAVTPQKAIERLPAAHESGLLPSVD